MRRWCPGCKIVTWHTVVKVADREHSRCESCGTKTRRYDLRPRTWAGK